MKKKFTKKKIKTILIPLSLVGIGGAIAVSTSYAAPMSVRQNKILFNGKIFDDYEQALRFYLSNKDVINKELMYGDIGKSMVNLNTGELNKKSLIKANDAKKSIVYKTAFGRYERDYDKAQSTYVNPLFSKTRFTYANSDTTYAKREDAQKALDASLFVDKAFYYKIKNNLYTNKNMSQLDAIFNKKDIVFNPFNQEQIDQLKEYLMQKDNYNKLNDELTRYWTSDESKSAEGFNMAVYAKGDKGNYKEFEYGDNTNFQTLYNEVKDKFKTKNFNSKQENYGRFNVFADDVGGWNDVDFVFSITNSSSGRGDTTISEKGGEHEESGIIEKELLSPANPIFKSKVQEIVFKYKTNDEENTKTIPIKWDEIIKNKEFENKIFKIEDKIIKNNIFNNLIKEMGALKDDEREFWNEEISVEMQKIHGRWSHHTNDIIDVLAGFSGWAGSGNHYFNIEQMFFKVKRTRRPKAEKSWVKKLDFLTRLFLQKKNGIKKVIKYNNQPIFEVVEKNGGLTLKQFSDKTIINKKNKFLQKLNFGDIANFNQAYLYTKRKLNKEEIPYLYMGKMENKNNNSNNSENKKLYIRFYWGERMFYKKEQFNSRIYSDEVNAVDSKLKDFWIQINTVKNSNSEIKAYIDKNAPVVNSIFVIFSIEGKPLISSESVTDNSKFDDIELLFRNARNKIKPEIDREHIFAFNKKQSAWKLFSSETHSIYSIQMLNQKHFDTYKHAKEYLIKYIKENSKII